VSPRDSRAAEANRVPCPYLVKGISKIVDPPYGVLSSFWKLVPPIWLFCRHVAIDGPTSASDISS
jgi:hypothetical protein